MHKEFYIFVKGVVVILNKKQDKRLRASLVAQSHHYIGTSTIIKNSDVSLTPTFKAAGRW